MKNCSKRIFRHSVSFGLFVFLLALFLSFGGTVGHAQTFIVNTISDDISNPTEGYLRHAINNAQAGDVISFNLAPYPKIINLKDQLNIENGMTIQGPGAEDLAVSGNDTCRVFYIDTTESVDISGISIVSGDAGTGYGGGIWNNSDNLTLTNCTFSYNLSDMYGGGMYNYESSPTLSNCIFTENSADFGGGMNNYLSSPDIANCTFSQNHARTGGGICNTTANPTVTNCIFSNNTASAFGSGIYNSGSAPIVISCDFCLNNANYGGGVDNSSSSDPIITECTFIDNYATYDGGGIRNRDNSSPDISRCTFSGNVAGSHGGGISNNSASPQVTNCVFTGNNANYGGGTFDTNSSSSDITYCTFHVNSANVDGGGMYSYHSNSIVTSCTFNGNTATRNGAGMYNSRSALSLTNSTFIGNTASNYGGGICNGDVEDMSSSVSADVINCTLSGNIAENGGGMYNVYSNTTVTNCIFWDNSENEIENGTTDLTLSYCVIHSDGVVGYPGISSNDIITADPMLEPLADNGGPTKTCALGEGSSAIDEGAFEEGMPTVDQRGVSRPQGSGYDIGAFEVEQASSSGGCNISSLPAVGFLLLMPLMFLSRRRK